MNSPKIRSLRVRALRVPLPVPHNTASGTLSESPLVLTDIECDDGSIGHSVVFTYTPAALKPVADLVVAFGDWIKGDAAAPYDVEQKLAQRLRLLGPQGLTGIAVAAIDMALWDAAARRQQMSLAQLLGGTAKPINAYGAVGYDGVDVSARTAEDWAKRGFKGIKAKIGYPSVAEDVAVIRAMRAAAGPEMAIMVDYNQCLTPTEAVQRMRRARRRRTDVGRRADPGARLRRPRADRARSRNADSMRRKLVGHARSATRARRRGKRLPDARRDENRRRDRLDARRSAGACGEQESIEPSVARDQRAACSL